jgi:hypothetical protein
MEITLEQVTDTLAEQWFKPGHGDAAFLEGWTLSDCDCDEGGHGPLQVQKLDNGADIQAAMGPGFLIPELRSDADAWRIVRDGQEPHHRLARALLAQLNPDELARVSRAIYPVQA